jgi:hypothetical protein
MWLKRLPASVCRRLGYDAAASVRALAGDGLSEAEIRRIGLAVETRAAAIVGEFEAIHRSLSVCGIRAEYARMLDGESTLCGPLAEAVSLVAWVLSLVDVHREAA